MVVMTRSRSNYEWVPSTKTIDYDQTPIFTEAVTFTGNYCMYLPKIKTKPRILESPVST